MMKLFSVLLISAAALSSGFEVVPGEIPNEGILFVDHQAAGRSGHGHFAVTECLNGEIIAFYSNTDADVWGGHSVSGWSEYKISGDGGKTWSEPYVLAYSKAVWEGDQYHSAMVDEAMTAPNGTIVATVRRYTDYQWGSDVNPVYIRSYDNGRTWTEPIELDPSAAPGRISRDEASLVYQDTLFVLLRSTDAARATDGKRFSLYVSTDNGETFVKRSDPPFDLRQRYGAMGVIDGGRLIVYSYNSRDDGELLQYLISDDLGYTWPHAGQTRLAKRIRNPQMSEKIGDTYFMHGRSGQDGDDPRHLVLYSSPDGIHWDEGVFLNKGRTSDLDSYSTNAVIGKYDPDTPNRLLIQSSIAYDGRRKVNVRHWWIDVPQAKPWSQNTGQLLYNGIRLPDVWPPRHFSPLSDEPMPVPYLEHRPAVIPINVGRQLFVDDFLVEHTDLRRTYHSARRYEGNPVFTPQTQQEVQQRGVVYLGHGGVFYDPQDQLFKMFYTAGWRGPLSLATSSDMIDWTRPDLSPETGNVLRGGKVDDNSVWLDIHAKDPAQRIKYLEADRRRGHMLYTSPDGLEWSEAVNTGRYRDDYTSFFYNPFRDVWVYSIRDRDKIIQPDNRGRRARYYAESPDFLDTNWDDAVYWTSVDWLDRPEPVGSFHPAAHEHGCQLYSQNAVAYESLLISMHYIHRGPVNQICQEGQFPKLTDLEVGFTRDGFHWHRPYREPFIAATRRDGDWDRAYLHSTTGVFVVMGDKLVFPYTGYSGHAPDGSQGMYHGASMGLAYLRRDGFASMDAGNQGGTLITRPVVFDGWRLFVNADIPDGELTVEILDKDGRPIEPFTLDNCVPFTGDSTLTPIAWKDGADLSALRQTPVRFRFRLTGGSLYAFWVSKDDTGRSDGYLGAGGPGYEDVVDTVGKAALKAEPQHVTVFHGDGRFAGWPANYGMWSWGNEILVGFRTGTHNTNVSLDGGHSTRPPYREKFARSLDGGLTWQIEDHEDMCWYRNQEVFTHAQACPEAIDFTHPDLALRLARSPRVNDVSYINYSYDRGKTWFGPYKFPDLGIKQPIDTRTDVIIDGKHEMLAFLSIGSGRTGLARTTDGAKSWEFVTHIGPDYASPNTGVWSFMPSSVRLSKSSLLTVIRYDKSRDACGLTAYRSDDNGQTWTQLDDPLPPRPMRRSSPPAMIRLDDGRIVLVYAVRQVSPSVSRICAKISDDQGATWSDEIVLRQDSANWDMGYNRVIQRPDGKLVTVYYYNHALDASKPPYRHIAATIWDPDAYAGR